MIVMEKDKQYVKILETGKIVEVHFKHRDGVAYVSISGVRLLFKGEYEYVQVEKLS